MFCHTHSKTKVSGTEELARDIRSASALLISNQMGSHNAASLLDSLRLPASRIPSARRHANQTLSG